MRRTTLLIVVLVIVALGIGGLFALSGRDDDNKPAETTSSSQTDTSATDQTTQPSTPETQANDSATQTSTDEVEIEDMAFQPASITVKAGTTVTWTNKDDIQHSVIPDDGDSDAFRGSQLLSRDQSYSFTFNTPGTYTYHCGPHPQMTGSVTVTE